MGINWMYANRFEEMASGTAEIVEALVAIAEQLDKLNQHLEKQFEEAASEYCREAGWREPA